MAAFIVRGLYASHLGGTIVSKASLRIIPWEGDASGKMTSQYLRDDVVRSNSTFDSWHGVMTVKDKIGRLATRGISRYLGIAN